MDHVITNSEKWDIVTVFEECGEDNWAPSRQANLWQELEYQENRQSSTVLLYADFNADKIQHSPILNQKDPDIFFPPEFFPVITADLNGDFFCEYDLDEQGQVTKHVSWSCFKIKHAVKPGEYKWVQTAVFVQWLPQKQQQIIFLLNLPQSMQEFLSKHRPPSKSRRENPYVWHTVFAQAVIRDYDKSIWSLRDLVRAIEKARNNPHPPALNFPNLHDIARHIFHSNETLDVATHTLQSLIDEQTRFRHEHPSLVAQNRGVSIQNYQRTHFVAKQLHSLKTRSRSLSERLTNEINLAFNLVSQKDSAMMRTVALVSMVYLPGTFISGLFGTNFFDLSENGSSQSWIVADNFWLYWAIMLPLTIATVSVWVSWHYFPHYYPRLQMKVQNGPIV